MRATMRKLTRAQVKQRDFLHSRSFSEQKSANARRRPGHVNCYFRLLASAQSQVAPCESLQRIQLSAKTFASSPSTLDRFAFANARVELSASRMQVVSFIPTTTTGGHLGARSAELRHCQVSHWFVRASVAPLHVRRVSSLASERTCALAPIYWRHSVVAAAVNLHKCQEVEAH